MEKLIWIFIILIIVHKLLGRKGKQVKFPRPVGQKTPPRWSREKDAPLPGPWDATGSDQATVETDRPLRGQWQREKEGELSLGEGGATADENQPPLLSGKTGDIQETSRGEETKKYRRQGQYTFKGGSPSGKRALPVRSYLSRPQTLAAAVVLSEVLDGRGGKQKAFNTGRH